MAIRLWNEMYIQYYTRTELGQPHLHFLHPSQQKLLNILKRGTPKYLKGDTARTIQDVFAKCDGCKQFGTYPFWFRVSLPNDEIIFNHEIAMDLFWGDQNALLHIAETHTEYQNFASHMGLSSQDVRNEFLEAWATVSVGCPNRVRAERGSVLSSKFWDDTTSLHGIGLQLSGVEIFISIGTGKRYHGSLRRVFRKKCIFTTLN